MHQSDPDRQGHTTRRHALAIPVSDLCGTIAAVAVAFAKFTGIFIPAISDQNVLFELGSFKFQTQQLLALVVVWTLTFSNFRSVKSGAFVQNIFTFTKIGAIVFLILAGGYYIFTQPLQPVNWSLGDVHFDTNFIGIFSTVIGIGLFLLFLVHP